MAVRLMILLFILCPIPVLAEDDTVPPALLRQLAHEDVSVRLRAIRELAELGEPGASHLVPLMTDDTLDVRFAAKRALLGLRGEAVPALVKGLESEGLPGGRMLCAELLGRLGEDARPALPVLAAVMRKDEDDHVRWTCAEALGKLGPIAAETAAALRKASADPELQVRRRAIAALGKIGPAGVPGLVEVFRDGKRGYWDDVVDAIVNSGEAMLPSLLVLLGDEDDWTRFLAADLIGRINGGPVGVEEALRKACEDPDERVACEAACALWRRTGDRGTVFPILARGLRSEDRYVRHVAIAAVSRVGGANPEVAEALADAIRRTEGGAVAVAAVRALGLPAVLAVIDAIRIGGPGTEALFRVLIEVRPVQPEAVPHLTTLLGVNRGRGTPNVHSALVDAGAPAVAHLVHVIESGAPRARSAAVRALRDLGEIARPAIPALEWALQVEGLRLDAAEALIAIGEIDPALAVLTGPLPPKERRRALALIRRIPEASRPLPAVIEPWLSEGTAGSRREAAQLWWEATGDAGPVLREWIPAFVRERRGARYELVRIGEPAVKPLIGLLEHEKSGVRCRAAMALGDIGAEASGAVAALKAALVDKSDVRYQAVVALGRIGPAARDTTPDLIELLRTGDRWVREAVLGAAPLIDPEAKGLREEAERATGSGVTDLRTAGALCLFRMTGESDPAVRLLIDVLRDPDSGRDELRNACGALREIGPPAAAAVPALMAVKNATCGVDALRALGSIAPENPEVRAALLKALEDQEDLTRAEAAWTLREMGPAGAFAIPALERTANDPESWIRSAARKALARIRE